MPERYEKNFSLACSGDALRCVSHGASADKHLFASHFMCIFVLIGCIVDKNTSFVELLSSLEGSIKAIAAVVSFVVIVSSFVVLLVIGAYFSDIGVLYPYVDSVSAFLSPPIVILSVILMLLVLIAHFLPAFVGIQVGVKSEKENDPSVIRNCRAYQLYLFIFYKLYFVYLFFAVVGFIIVYLLGGRVGQFDVGIGVALIVIIFIKYFVYKRNADLKNLELRGKLSLSVVGAFFLMYWWVLMSFILSFVLSRLNDFFYDYDVFCFSVSSFLVYAIEIGMCSLCARGWEFNRIFLSFIIILCLSVVFFPGAPSLGGSLLRLLHAGGGIAVSFAVKDNIVPQGDDPFEVKCIIYRTSSLVAYHHGPCKKNTSFFWVWNKSHKIEGVVIVPSTCIAYRM